MVTVRALAGEVSTMVPSGALMVIALLRFDERGWKLGALVLRPERGPEVGSGGEVIDTVELDNDEGGGACEEGMGRVEDNGVPGTEGID
jgi:hypothetical protein